jgi:large conductance mechanosensitive channel
MWKDFKAFISKGNVIDLAIGIIIGAAFSKIVSSFVADVLMPVLSLGLGKVDFKYLYIPLDGRHYDSLDAAKAAAAPTMNYGIFLNSVVDFLIVAFAVFMIMQLAHKLEKKRKTEEPPPPDTKECRFCLSKIPVRAIKCAQCCSMLEGQPATT